MHIPKAKFKPRKDKPFIPIHSHWEVPEYRRLRGKRYDTSGKFVGLTGRQNRPDPIEREAVKLAQRAAKKMAPPVEYEGFKLESLTLLPGRILLKRPKQITEINGLELPRSQVRSEPYFYVIKVAPDVTGVAPCDRVVIGKGHKPKDVRIGRPLYIARASHVVATIEGASISLAEILA